MIEKLKKEIDGVEVECELGKTVGETIEGNENGLTPFVKLLWSEQKKYNVQGSVSYHPMIICFALSLATKSSTAYDELRRSGILILPSRRTLQDYTNAVKPSAYASAYASLLSQNCAINTKILMKSRDFDVLSFDEIKIQSNLVFDKHSGKVIGFVDIGDVDFSFATFSNLESLATHVLCVFVRNFTGQNRFNLGYFATHGVLAHQLLPLFWKAVAILEISCNLKVIAAVCDGASCNRKFIKKHILLNGRLDKAATRRTEIFMLLKDLFGFSVIILA